MARTFERNDSAAAPPWSDPSHDAPVAAADPDGLTAPTGLAALSGPVDGRDPVTLAANLMAAAAELMTAAAHLMSAAPAAPPSVTDPADRGGFPAAGGAATAGRSANGTATAPAIGSANGAGTGTLVGPADGAGTGTLVGPADGIAAVAAVTAPARESRFAVFSVPGFLPTYIVGVVWSMCRWGLGFLGAYYVVNELKGSPLLSQLTGSMLWAPLLAAGMVGGAISDRFSRRRVLFLQFVVLAPLTVGVGLLALGYHLPLGVLYGFMVLAGFGWVIDMTVRRAMVYDIVGDRHLNQAMAFEGLSSSLGLAAGAIAGGQLLQRFGPGKSYLVVAGAMVVAAALVLRAPKLPAPTRPAAQAADGASGAGSFKTQLVEGVRALRANPALLSILGVTAIVNFFHFAYFPIVPVIAKRVGADASGAGFLAAATGFGMAIGSTFVLARRPARGRAYVVGSVGAFLMVNGFALFTHYLPVYVSLLVASSFVGVFGATQAALTMTAVPPEMRGRALGMLSMAIGWLPLGMYGLGQLAAEVGAPTALVLANGVGLVALVAFLAWRPQVLRIH